MQRILWVFLLLTVNWLNAEAGRYALVIGNSAYQGQASLAHAANDASDMADGLEAIGWKVTRLVNGDRRAMNDALLEFGTRLAEDPSSADLLYYAGHGIQLDGQNYLLPVGTNYDTEDDVTVNGIRLQTVLSSFEDDKASLDIVILDACRDNPFLKKSTRSLGSSRGLATVSKVSAPEGTAVLFATAPGATASDGSGRNGLFTQALLHYLNSNLTLASVATRVTGEVKRLSGGAQVPYSSLSLTDDFYLLPDGRRTASSPETPASAIAAASTKTKSQHAVSINLLQPLIVGALATVLAVEEYHGDGGFDWLFDDHWGLTGVVHARIETGGVNPDTGFNRYKYTEYAGALGVGYYADGLNGFYADLNVGGGVLSGYSEAKWVWQSSTQTYGMSFASKSSVDLFLQPDVGLISSWGWLSFKTGMGLQSLLPLSSNVGPSSWNASGQLNRYYLPVFNAQVGVNF